MAAALRLACALLPWAAGRAGAGPSVPAMWTVPGEHGTTRDWKPTQALLAVLKIGGMSARLDSITFSPFVTVQHCGVRDTVGLRCAPQAALPCQGLSAQLCRGNGLLQGWLFFFVWLFSVFSSIILQCCSMF